MKLRRWVKVTLAIIISVVGIVLFAKWDKYETDMCVNGGNTTEFCNRVK